MNSEKFVLHPLSQEDDCLLHQALDYAEHVLKSFYDFRIARPSVALYESIEQMREYMSYLGRNYQDYTIAQSAWFEKNQPMIVPMPSLCQTSFQINSCGNVYQFQDIITHELAHTYFNFATGNQNSPKWLNEGMSCFFEIATQQPTTKEKVVRALTCFDTRDKSLYQNNIINGIIRDFGEDKLKTLIFSIRSAVQESGIFNEYHFAKLFQKVFGEPFDIDVLAERWSR